MAVVIIVLVLSIAAVVLLVALASRTPKPSIEHLPEVFIVADLETTGLDSDQHEVIELAALKVHRELPSIGV